MAENFEDPSKKRRLDEDGTASAFAENTAESRKEKLETWLKPLDNEQLLKLLLDMYVGNAVSCCIVLVTHRYSTVAGTGRYGTNINTPGTVRVYQNWLTAVVASAVA